jgi:hypothetical protein
MVRPRRSDGVALRAFPLFVDRWFVTSGERRVLVCCWSSKGGSGTTVVAAALAVVLSKLSASGALLVDLAGDVPAVLGLTDPEGAGVSEWLREGELVPADGLARVEVRAHDRLAILPRGRGPMSNGRAGALAALLAADPRPVVVDGGVVATPTTVDQHTELVAAIAANADQSLLVVRPCFLALRRAVVAPVRPTGVVLIEEDGRALTASDVEDVLGVPVQASISVTAQVARAVDAGLLASRLPRSLERELRHAA